ncbi:ABC transporter [Variovorax paradoxus]|jgi:iron(III) transport system ATP-binding protein/putative spermidine/putrescine transport system ATP-binding protein|uniref:ABC transporter ATP-binding protein n=1 Tax=Variovorax TaxID=34072 RepID=UPI0006E72877|nr:ABC transporter ATP-binding protein [Variovorax sp. CY25R-8]KPU95112.1 ABC transporter [Variovorax paradoxus]KPV10346.1 ABC transporter [Variovorax paradoxus]KPV12822.1 ABC transporter [Variovorax paradoxus]KPV24048.1 ABC transporter [Variovorax paradoxus]KPV35164.1 ABC transporter [Variovorax paradoxus]
MSKLELRNLSKRYGATPVVDAVSLQLQRGELVTLLGPSGCGKTTTLRMIAGFIEPSDGTIVVDGAEISSPARSVSPEHRGMSMIFQSYAIWPNMTVAQNVGFGLRVRKTPDAEIARRVAEMLDVVKLGALAQRYPAELSGGQQQRVALARAMIVRPEVLLLDEPLSNLDANLREEMATEIRRLHDQFHFTTVYVTHDQAEAMAISDRIAVLHQGRLEQIDTPWNLYNRPRTPFVAGFIGKTNLVEGELDGDRLRLDGLAAGFALPGGAAGGARLLASIRPQSLYLDAAPAGAVALGDVSVVGRTYLGEYWNYLVRPSGGGASLKVHAAPSTVLEIGQRSTIYVDPGAVAAIQ